MAFVPNVAEHVAVTATSPRGFCGVNNVSFVDVAARRHIKASVVILENLPIRRLLLRHLQAAPPLSFAPCLRQTQVLLAYRGSSAWSQ